MAKRKMPIEMDYSASLFEEYTTQLTEYLFPNYTLNELIQLSNNDHQAFRMLCHHLFIEGSPAGLIRQFPDFQKDIVEAYNTLVYCIEHEMDESLFSESIRDDFNKRKDQYDLTNVDSYRAKTMWKDFLSYRFWAWKKELNE